MHNTHSIWESHIVVLSGIFQFQGMQGTLREFEDWLEHSIPEAVMIAYEKALSKLEECLPYEDTLVSIKQLLSTITLKLKLWLSWFSGAPH